MDRRNTGPLVSLAGAPAEVGRAFGSANAADIRAEVAGFYTAYSRDAVLRAGEHYRTLVERYAPYWLEEAAALAGAADVRFDDYVAYQGAKYRGINRPECFTYFSAPRHNAGDVTLFHKNRDNWDRPQCAYVKALKAPGQTIYRFAATGDTSDMGTMMGLNERGLAVAADTGAPDPNPRYRGMMNPDVMRLILERAGDVVAAREMIRQVHADRAYAGANIATNWMFADGSGRAMRLVQFHASLHETRDEDGLPAMREDERGRLVLNAFRKSRGTIAPRLMNRLARTRPVLADTNISGMTAVIPATHPHLFGYAQFAVYRADRTVFVPLYMGATAIPRILADGTLYRLSRARADDLDVDALEDGLENERVRVEADARAALAQGGEADARRVLTEGCQGFAEQASRFLVGAPPDQSRRLTRS